MRDVAQQAGVSPTTVSFVLNDAPNASNIPIDTKERIRATIRSLGYRPNAAAQILRTDASHSIGFITDAVATNPFAGAMISGAQEAAWEQGNLLLIVNTGGDPVVAAAAVEMMLERRVGGIIYAAIYPYEVDPPRALAEVPSVLVDCYSADRSLPSVVPDEEGGGWAATDFLLGKGHRRIGFVNVHPSFSAAHGRLTGYQRALAAAGVPFDPALVRHSSEVASADDGYRCASELLALAERPTALFCAGDHMAMGAYDVIKERGYRIPSDIAVMGFDNHEIISRYLRPTLSTVALPYDAMVRWAIQYLLNAQNAALTTQPEPHRLPCPLIVRDSV
jgi:LacI family transcriptional regulator